MSDGIKKNFEVVVQGFRDLWVDWKVQTHKLKAAWRNKDYAKVVHYASGYYSAVFEHLYRFFFYTAPIKWAIIIWLIVD